jgi:hypothetical protein
LIGTEFTGGISYGVGKRNGICVTARSRKRDPGSQIKW